MMTWVLEVVWVGRNAPGRGHGLEVQWCELSKYLGVVEHELLWRRREVREAEWYQEGHLSCLCCWCWETPDGLWAWPHNQDWTLEKSLNLELICGEQIERGKEWRQRDQLMALCSSLGKRWWQEQMLSKTFQKQFMELGRWIGWMGWGEKF